MRVSSPQVRVSFIVPVRTGDFPRKCVQHISDLSYPRNQIEIIVCEGQSPSRQRNLAAEHASGDILYFVDDNSFISPTSLNVAVEALSSGEVAAVGGPALCVAHASRLQRLVGEITSSPFGTLHMSARNRSRGQPRRVRGEELILCNLAVSRSVFRHLSGFDERLFPNEENEFFKRLRREGYELLYHPEMTVEHEARDSLWLFLKQIFAYGAGRGDHLLRGMHVKDLIFFGPTALVVLVLVIPVLSEPLARTGRFAIGAYLALMLLGSLLVAVTMARSSNTRRYAATCFGIAALPCLLLMHLAYGVGLPYGLLRRKKTSATHAEFRIHRFPVGELHVPPPPAPAPEGQHVFCNDRLRRLYRNIPLPGRGRWKQRQKSPAIGL